MELAAASLPKDWEEWMASAHIIARLDDIMDLGSLNDGLNWLFSQHLEFYQISLCRSGWFYEVPCRAHPHRPNLHYQALGYGWARALQGNSYFYPRLHILPEEAKVCWVGDEEVLLVWLTAHIDEREHRTDYGLYREANEILSRVRQWFHGKFFGHTELPNFARGVKLLEG